MNIEEIQLDIDNIPENLYVKWNKERARFWEGDVIVDFGPSYTRVWIEEVPE